MSAWLPRGAESVVYVFTVTVKYSGQPGCDAGDYPTRELAAHAAAKLAATDRPDGERPVAVGIHEVADARTSPRPRARDDH
jgi:hypothetical protein